MAGMISKDLKILVQNATYVTTLLSHDRMTMHRNRFLVNKTKRGTEFKFYWYYYSILHLLGSLSALHQEIVAVHRLWYILC